MMIEGPRNCNSRLHPYVQHILDFLKITVLLNFCVKSVI